MTGTASVEAVNGSGPIKCSQPSLNANRPATSAVMASGVRHNQAQSPAAIRPCSTPENPTYHCELRLEYEEPEIDRDGRSDEDDDPAAEIEFAREKRGDEREADEVPGEVRQVVMEKMGGDEPRVFAAGQDGGAVVGQGLPRRRAEQLDRDEHERERERRAPCACAELRQLQQLRKTSQVHACAGSSSMGLL